MTTSERDHRPMGTLPDPGRTDRHGPPPDGTLPAALAGLFRGQAIYDGAGMIKLELPHIVEGGALTLVSVAVNWPMVLSSAMACLYLIADHNAIPLLTRMTLLPDIVPPHLSLEIRLETATYVRALVQCGDGPALEAKRWVWVTPSPGGAGSVLAG